jgi:DMSO reductase family type II enzyme chaperone
MPTDLEADRIAEANAALARSAVYRLLSQAFAYPTPLVAGGLLEEDLPLAHAVSAWLPEPVRRALGDAALALEGATADTLEAGYRAVFSHVHSTDCPTYETDYTVKDVWKQTRELADLGGFYRAFGMQEQGERPDNICVELEFLHLASYKQAWAIVQREGEPEETCRAAQEAFLRDHLLKWVPGFALRVRALAGSGPYAAFADLAREFLGQEAIRFGLDIAWTIEPPVRLPDEEAVEETALCEGDS